MSGTSFSTAETFKTDLMSGALKNSSQPDLMDELRYILCRIRQPLTSDLQEYKTPSGTNR